MIYAEKGKEQECFIDFVEKALGILAQEKYHDFLAVFDNSRILTEEDLISALQYLDETRPVLKYQELYWLLKPLLVSPERSMFMKKEDWEKRLKRFEEIQS